MTVDERQAMVMNLLARRHGMTIAKSSVCIPT